MNEFSKVVSALLVLTIVAVLLASGQTASFISACGAFLASMAKKVTSA